MNIPNTSKQIPLIALYSVAIVVLLAALKLLCKVAVTLKLQLPLPVSMRLLLPGL